MEFNRDSVGKTIRKYRLNKGLSQEIVSGLADIQRSHLADIERGKKLPSLPTLWKLCEALEVDPHEIIKAIEDY